MATNFGLANEYNVFVFGDMALSNANAEGRVAVGGAATLCNYGVGAGITPLPPANTDPSFVVGGAVNVSAGSNASGNTVISPTSTVIHYTMDNPNGTLITGASVNFSEAEQYLMCASVFWATLEPNGVGEVVSGRLNLTGTDDTLNVFTFESSDIYGTGVALNQLNGINIIAPLSSTILINITGPDVQYGSHPILRNGTDASRKNARRILWNYPEALNWSSGATAIYGSVLAPFADASAAFSQFHGNIIFSSLTGNAESHNEPFEGELPEAIHYLATTSSSGSAASAVTTTSNGIE